MTRARDLSRLSNPGALSVGGNNNVGVNSTAPVSKLNVVGVVSATSYFGDGSNLSGISASGLGTALGETTPLDIFFKTPEKINIGSATSIAIESDATSGNIAFVREGIIRVSNGSTMRVGTGTTLRMNVLGLF